MPTCRIVNIVKKFVHLIGGFDQTPQIPSPLPQLYTGLMCTGAFFTRQKYACIFPVSTTHILLFIWMQYFLLADVRWNSAGILGGRALLSAVKQNSVLCNLELKGNNVPVDIANAISEKP